MKYSISSPSKDHIKIKPNLEEPCTISALQLNKSTSGLPLDTSCSVAKSGIPLGSPRGESLIDACFEGLDGIFNPLANDFSRHPFDDCNAPGVPHPVEAHWSGSKRQKVKRFRYVICSLGLMAVAVCLMSRLMLSVAIVEMTVAPTTDTVRQSEDPSQATETGGLPGEAEISASIAGPHAEVVDQNNELDALETTTIVIEVASEQQQRFNWSVADKNLVTGSFYIGYGPSMMFGGRIAERYGAKIPLFTTLLGTVIVQALLPTIARLGLGPLVALRITFGLVQGCLVPSLYELFNKWLTPAELCIFAPMLKVSAALGMLIGVLVPGAVSALGYGWSVGFYVMCFPCALLSLAWFILATSTPQTNWFVTEDELKRIMRKKVKLDKVFIVAATPTNSADRNKGSSINGKLQVDPPVPVSKLKAEDPTPWLKIILNPSVLALTLAKFTYNLGNDLISLVLPMYLGAIQNTSTSMISVVSSLGFLIQLFLVTFVGWFAKHVVEKKVFGLSRTKWRKIFQGAANFGSALCCIALAFTGSRLWLVSLLTLGICFWTMFGAGGESMIPYDLSFKYPATIMGIAHSISMMSGLLLPLFVSLVLGDDEKNPERWNLLFVLIALGMIVGGIVFILFVKAKPFLPDEKAISTVQPLGK